MAQGNSSTQTGNTKAILLMDKEKAEAFEQEN